MTAARTGKLAINRLRERTPLDAAAVDDFLGRHEVPVVEGSHCTFLFRGEADEVLLDAARAVRADNVEFVVISNDGIFATLADRGRLTVLSPGVEALSDRLAQAAARVVDLPALEASVVVPVG